jgi:hypothetical protein
MAEIKRKNLRFVHEDLGVLGFLVLLGYPEKETQFLLGKIENRFTVIHLLSFAFNTT